MDVPHGLRDQLHVHRVSTGSRPVAGLLMQAPRADGAELAGLETGGLKSQACQVLVRVCACEGIIAYTVLVSMRMLLTL